MNPQMDKMVWMAVGLMMMAVAGNGAIIFSDDFTGTNGAPVNPTKWNTYMGAGASITIQNNQASITSAQQWQAGEMTSKVGADFFSPGAVATYSVDTSFSYTPYDLSYVIVAGSSGNLTLKWTTEWQNGNLTTYTLSNKQGTLWTGTRWNDTGERISITLEPTTYTLTLYAFHEGETWATPSGTHGLAASDFVGGGKLRLHTEKDGGADITVAYDNVSITAVPEPLGDHDDGFRPRRSFGLRLAETGRQTLPLTPAERGNGRTI